MALHGLRAAGKDDAIGLLLEAYHDLLIDDSKLQEKLNQIKTGNSVGSQLWRLLESLGVQHTASCPCLKFAEQMNAWGVAGCREHRAEIVEHMRTNAKAYGWSTVATAAAKSVLTGVAFRLSIFDPYGSLVDEAIRRAAEALDSQPIDILLPLGPGSKFENIEIRHAIRSIEQHAIGLRHIVIVGAIPRWLRETERVRLVSLREFKCNKASRISLKVKWAFENLGLTDRVAFWNDDYLMLRDFNIREIPNYYRGELWRSRKDSWRRLLNHTAETLHAAGYGAKHFDIHVPIIYERAKFLAINDWWERSRMDGQGLVAKSVYGNIHCAATATPCRDAKSQGEWQRRIDEIAGRRWIMSYGDGALKAGFGDWMKARWPQPSGSEFTPKPTVRRVKPQRRNSRRRQRGACC